MQFIPAYEIADIANAAETVVSGQYIVGYADGYVYSVDGELLRVNSRSFHYVYFYTYFEDIENVLLRFIERRVPVYVKTISVSSSSSSSGSHSESRSEEFHSIDWAHMRFPVLFQCNLCYHGAFQCHYSVWRNYSLTATWNSSSSQQFVLDGVDKPAKEMVSFGIFYSSAYYPVLRFFRRYNIVLRKLSTSNFMSSAYERVYSYTKIYCDCPGHPGYAIYNEQLYKFYQRTTFSSEDLGEVIENNRYGLVRRSVANAQWSSRRTHPWTYFPDGKCIDGVSVWGGVATGDYNEGCRFDCYDRSRSSQSSQYFLIGCFTDKVR